MTCTTVLGATGRAGSAILRLLPSTIEVTAALRKTEDLSRLPELGRPVTGVAVDIDDPVSLRRAITGADVVVNAVRLRGDIDPAALVDLHERIVEATQTSAGSSVPIVTVGGAGALNMPDGTRFWQASSFPRRTLPRGRAHARLRAHMEASPTELPWAYLVPPPDFDPDGPHTGEYHMWPPGADESAFCAQAISYTDFAEAVCAAVEERWTGTWLVAAPQDR